DGLDEDMSDLPVDEDGPGYPALAVLLRARMTALPAPSTPAAPHGDSGEGRVGLTALQLLAQLAAKAGSPFGARTPITIGGHTAVAALPAKRTKSDQPAPAYRILVEKVLDRDETATYPRCTGGRRAAPPEDCGGTWGYADLVETLNDPEHPEHQDRLEWLGLDHAADFDPDRFNAETVTQALSRLA